MQNRSDKEDMMSMFTKEVKIWDIPKCLVFYSAIEKLFNFGKGLNMNFLLYYVESRGGKT